MKLFGSSKTLLDALKIQEHLLSFVFKIESTA